MPECGNDEHWLAAVERLVAAEARPTGKRCGSARRRGRKPTATPHGKPVELNAGLRERNKGEAASF
jgi:hypothetical protein